MIYGSLVGGTYFKSMIVYFEIQLQMALFERKLQICIFNQIEIYNLRKAKITMPPKKKEEQIDLSTLPECVSTNGMLFCLGRKQRSEKILNQILAHNKPFITQITRHQVLDHAKQKNIYIDPATLTDKQKKDAKFMQTICTELTPEVFAKAVKSLIEQLSIKIRLQLKLHNEKPQQQRPKFLQEKKLDQLFLIPSDFCISREQYEALAAINQGVKYIMVLNPIISWANAPQIDQQEVLQEGEQEDEDIKELKLLRKKEELTEDDKNHQTQVSRQIEQIKVYRKECHLQSSFRDCIIELVDCEIDPYNEEQSISEAVSIFSKRLGKLYVQYDEFMEWRKDKVKVDIMAHQQIEKQPQQVGQQSKNKKVQSKLNGVTTVQILNNFIDSLFGQSITNQQENDGIESLINDFDFGQEQTQNNQIDEQEPLPTRRNKKLQFYSQNDDSILFQKNQAILQEQSRNRLHYPGIHRYLMPDIPLKSEPLRKLERSYYSQYLTDDLPFEELQRRLALRKFQEIIKEVDEDRKYILTDRMFEQHHDEKSLMRQLYRALLIYDDGHFLSRYSEEDDKLYLALVYKNNQRRLHSKHWESGWKVLPNYESWLRYFKENEQNMNTNSFYDIDYQKIGNINQKVRAFSVPDNGVIVRKQSMIAGELNQFLYGIKNHHLFGLVQDNQKNGIFYSENKKTKINHFSVQKQGQQSEYETQIIVDENMTIRLKPKTGDVIVEVKGQDRRMYTPSGYTVIYGQQAGNAYKILHPTGGISVPNSYINERGFGLKNNIIHSVPTLLRRQEEEGFTIIKRDDNTVTVEEESKKWIRFEDGTEYLVTDSQTQIQRASFPFIKCSANRIQVEINDLVIVGLPEQSSSYQFQLEFNGGNTIAISGSEVRVTETLSQIPYIIDLKAQTMKIEFDNQMLEVSFNHEKYMKNGRIFDPTQNEQNYSEEQTLPQDHIQPKLFIISPNGHGVEYLSQHQLAYQFTNKQNQNEKNHLIKEIPNNHLTSNLHIISKIPTHHSLNPQRINLDKNINLDIFKSEKYFTPKVLVEKFTVRSLIKHKNLLPQDQQLISDIKQKKQEWLKKMRKEENEFGHKARGDEVIQQMKRDKLLTIEFRKKNLTEVDFSELREEAISNWKSKENERLTLVALQEEEDKIKMKLGKRIQQVAGDYLPLAVSRKEEVEEKKYFVTPSDCYTHYFQTIEGKKALQEMPDWIFRPKTAKVKRELDPQILSEINRTMNQTKKQMPDEQLQQQQRYDTVDVNLKPVKQIYIKPSVFTQRQIDQERDAFEQQKKAYFYHQKKRKDFNLYGEERKQKVQVKSMLRTQPISQINQKYLITEAPLDKRIKISSMKNKLTSQASTLIEMRKQGPHQTLLRTLDKRNDYNTLLEKRTMMVHADLNDKLQRDILITPVEVQFGYLKEGRWYEFKINVKNEDILAQRLVVKRARNINVKVMMNEMGPIALGMSRKIIVQINASSEFMGRFTDEFQIVSKHEIYKIPIRAQIVSESQFEKDGVKLSPNVKEIQEGLKRKTSGLPPIN